MSSEHSRFLDPKNDFAFKRIFGREENKDILIAFLNDMLDHHYIGQIVAVTFLLTIQDPDTVDQKESLLDVLCEDQLGRQYIVEMQIARTDHFLKRAQYYASKAYSRQLQRGHPYSDLKEVIFLAIVDFPLFEGLHEIVLKMLAQGYPADEIQRLTGMSATDLQGPRQ